MVTATWQAARDKVRRDLWRPGTDGVPDATADEAIHNALLEIEGERRWFFLEKISAMLPVVGSTFALPGDAGPVSSLAITRPSSGATRDILVTENLDRVRYRVATFYDINAWPSCYATNGGTVYLDANVQVGSTAELIYTARTPAALADALAAASVATLALQTSAVCTLAAAYVAATFLKDDAEGNRQLAAYSRMLDRMILTDDTANEDKQGSEVRGDTFYQDAAFGFSAYD